jgi:hypothetical protein
MIAGDDRLHQRAVAGGLHRLARGRAGPDPREVPDTLE